MEGTAEGEVEDWMLKGHGVMNGLACPKESAKPSRGLLEGSGSHMDHSKA